MLSVAHVTHSMGYGIPEPRGCILQNADGHTAMSGKVMEYGVPIYSVPGLELGLRNLSSHPSIKCLVHGLLVSYQRLEIALTVQVAFAVDWLVRTAHPIVIQAYQTEPGSM